MIGLYAQNSSTQIELCKLLQENGVESYCPSHNYNALIWLSAKPAPDGIPVFTIKDLSLPLSLGEWISFIQQSNSSTFYYQNEFFTFNSSLRLITELKTKKQIPLTEKESDLLVFLCKTPERSASREEILRHVWQYNPQTQTHTLESHLYGLKQKLNNRFEKLLKIQKDTIQLI